MLLLVLIGIMPMFLSIYQGSKSIGLHSQLYNSWTPQHHTCDTLNICYIIECKKCNQQYIGETHDTAKKRFLQHRGYVRRKEMDWAKGQHFNLPGHAMADITISVLERIRQTDPAYRKQRESDYIEQFETKRKGINRKRWLFWLGTHFKKL